SKQAGNRLLPVGPGLILAIDVATKLRVARVKIEPSTCWPNTADRERRPKADIRARSRLNCRHELTDCVPNEALLHHRPHMASKERSCPLSFRRSSRRAAPD